MPVAAVFQFAVPAPHTGSFTDGEQALSVASPIGTAAGRTTFRLARWFDFEGGVYTIKYVVADAAAWFTSVSETSGRPLMRSNTGDAVQQQTVFIPRGRFRLDILLSNLSTGQSSCYVAFSIRQGTKVVYASTASGWVFDTAAIPNSAVPAIADRRLSFPLFPFMPNWSGGVTERIQFMTEILASETDAEQRRSPRRFARRSFEASFLRQGAYRSRLDNFFLGSGSNEVLLPLWHEQYRLQGNLGTTLAFPESTLVMREFRGGDLAVLIRNPSDAEILTIASHDLNTDTITFTAAPTGQWGAGDVIMPLRVAKIMDAVRFENQTDNVTTAQARFELDEPLLWPDPSWAYCSPLFRFKPNRATALSIDFNRLLYPFDSETGPVDVTDYGQRARVGTRLSLALRGRPDVYRFRQFINKARGRAVRFWMPDWMQDIIPAVDIAGPYIDAVPAGFVDYIRTQQDARLMIGVEFLDGRPTLYREITNVVEVSGAERFAVDPALPPIEKSEVARIMFVLPSRFDQDGFEIQHPVDDSAVAQTTLVVRSAERAGLPPIECFTTSKPYSLVEVDSVDVLPSLVTLDIVTIYAPEAITYSASLLTGTLRTTLQQNSMAPEAITYSALLQAGTLREILRSHSIAAEAITYSASLQAGTLREALISYNNYAPEAITYSAQILGGTLS